MDNLSRILGFSFCSVGVFCWFGVLGLGLVFFFCGLLLLFLIYFSLFLVLHLLPEYNSTCFS